MQDLPLFLCSRIMPGRTQCQIGYRGLNVHQQCVEQAPSCRLYYLASKFLKGKHYILSNCPFSLQIAMYFQQRFHSTVKCQCIIIEVCIKWKFSETQNTSAFRKKKLNFLSVTKDIFKRMFTKVFFLNRSHSLAQCFDAQTEQYLGQHKFTPVDAGVGWEYIIWNQTWGPILATHILCT